MIKDKKILCSAYNQNIKRYELIDLVNMATMEQEQHMFGIYKFYFYFEDFESFDAFQICANGKSFGYLLAKSQIKYPDYRFHNEPFILHYDCTDSFNGGCKPDHWEIFDTVSKAEIKVEQSKSHLESIKNWYNLFQK